MVSRIVSNLKSVKKIYYNIYNKFRELDYKANQLFQSMWCFLVYYFKKVRELELRKNKSPFPICVLLLRVYNFSKFKAVYGQLVSVPTTHITLAVGRQGVGRGEKTLFLLHAASESNTPGSFILPEAVKLKKNK